MPKPTRPLSHPPAWEGLLASLGAGIREELWLRFGAMTALVWLGCKVTGRAEPGPAVAWLANKIAPHGLALEPGQVVLSGSFIRPIETRKGDTIQADYGAWGSVSCYFA